MIDGSESAIRLRVMHADSVTCADDMVSARIKYVTGVENMIPARNALALLHPWITW